MLDLGDVLRDLTAHGEGAVVAIVTAAKGGAARPGSKVVFDARGRRRAGDAVLPEAALERLAERARAALGRGEPEVLELDDASCGARISVYLEPQLPRPELLVLGHGPIADALRRIGGALGYRIRVVGRGSAADKPGAVASEDPGFDGVEPPGPLTHVVVTTAHEADEAALVRALAGRPASVQLVASAKRLPAVREALARRGLDPARVRAPAGLDLGGREPEEIALSIVAEVVRLRHGGTGRPLVDVRGTASAPVVAPAARPAGFQTLPTETRPVAEGFQSWPTEMRPIVEIPLDDARPARPTKVTPTVSASSPGVADADDFRAPTKPGAALPLDPGPEEGEPGAREEEGFR